MSHATIGDLESALSAHGDGTFARITCRRNAWEVAIYQRGVGPNGADEKLLAAASGASIEDAIDGVVGRLEAKRP